MSDEPTAEDDFGKFFDNLSALATEKKSIPANFGASDDVVQPAADPVAAAVPADAGASAAEPGPVAAEPAPTVASVPDVTIVSPPRSDDAAALNRLADVLDRRAPQPAPAYQQPAPAPRLYTDEETTFLTTVDKDFPEIMRAAQLLMRGTTVQNNAYIMQRVNERVAPIEEVGGTVAANYHVDTLHRVIPDYDTIYDPVDQWVNTDRSIPPPLRAAYRGVMQNGEVSDVKWLTDEWRKATGKQTPPVTQAKPGNELSEAAKQAAVALAPVVSRATAVVTSADPVTFDDAWSKWSAPAKA